MSDSFSDTFENMFGITHVIRAADSLFGGAPQSPPPAPPAPAGSPAPAPAQAAAPSSGLADTLLPPASGSTATKPGPAQGGTVNPVDINRDAHNEPPKQQGPKPGLNTTPGPATPDSTKPASPKPGQPGWEGSAAQKEAEAAKQLKTKVEALKALDQQLDQLGKQIVDDNAEAKKKLKTLQDDIEKELKYQETSSDSSVVKQAALNKFMTDKADEAAKVITDAAATVAQRQGELTGLGNQYPGDVSGAGGGGYTDPYGAGGGYGASDPYAAGYGGEYSGEAYGDPYYDEGYGAESEFGDAASQLAGALPQMASALPGMLSGAGGANPLGDLGSIIGSAVKGAGEDRRDDTDRAEEDRKEKEESEKPPTEDEKPAEPKTNEQTTPPEPKEDKADPDKPDAKPEGQAPPAPPAPTLVVRPDGTNATAASPASAAAARAILGGASLEDAYKAAGITLPPPATPIKDTLPSLASAQIGDLAVFKDRYVMLMGDNKVYMDGQVQAASALAKLTGFVAFRKAPEPTTPFVPTAAAPAAAEHAVSPAV